VAVLPLRPPKRFSGIVKQRTSSTPGTAASVTSSVPAGTSSGAEQKPVGPGPAGTVTVRPSKVNVKFAPTVMPSPATLQICRNPVRRGVGVGVTVAVLVGVAVAVGVLVGVAVGVGVLVGVGVTVGVGVACAKTNSMYEMSLQTSETLSRVTVTLDVPIPVMR
jgi:hypothetical protein